MCPPWPDPSVYIISSCVGICRSLCLCSSAALSLLEVDIDVMAASFHHDGFTCVSMCSMLGYVYSGKCLIRFSRFDVYGRFPSLRGCVIHAWIGWFFAVDAIHVMVLRILSVRCHCGDSSSVSCFIAEIAVVRKHPVIARIILSCNEESACSWDVVGVVRVSLGLCQIIAA